MLACFTDTIFRTNTLVKSSIAEFHLKKHFEEKTIDDRIVDTVFSLEEEVSSGRFINIRKLFFPLNEIPVYDWQLQK